LRRDRRQGRSLVSQVQTSPKSPSVSAKDLSATSFGAWLTTWANITREQLADLELRHRRRARAEDRIRAAKDPGLANLPLHDFAQNQSWCAIVALAADLVAWMQTLALTEHRPGAGSPRAAPSAGLDRWPLRVYRPPPAAAPGRHRALGRPGPHRTAPPRCPGRARLTICVLDRPDDGR
jgi:Transposase DDE domain group 1